MKARPIEEGAQPAYAPVPIEEVTAAIREEKPDLVFCASCGDLCWHDALR